MQQKYVEIAKRISNHSEYIKLHSHHFYEVVFVTNGSCDYIIGERQYTAAPGNIILLPPHISHQVLLPKDPTLYYERFVLWLQKDFVEHLQQFDATILYCFDHCKSHNNYLLKVSEATSKGLELCFLNIYHESTKQQLNWEVSISSIAVALLVHLNRTYEKLHTTPTKTYQDTVLEQLVGYIDLHLHEKITIKEVAQALHISPSSLSHLAKQQLNVSLYQFILQRRLIVAKNHILSGTPIHTAWENLGFSDYSNFFRAFKKEYGVSPTAFKRMYQK